MKKSILLVLFTVLSVALYAQKVKIKDGFAKVDGENYLKWEKDGPMEATLSGLSAENDEIFVMWLNYKDPNQVKQSNPEGYVRWLELNFLELDLKCEIASEGRKGLVKTIITNELYVDGVLNQANVEKFVKKYGMRYSENRPGGNVNIIINN